MSTADFFPSTPPRRVPVWALAGVGSGLLISGLVVLIGMRVLRFESVAKGRTTDFSASPAKMAALITLAASPELELVRTDDASGTLTARDRKSGDEMTAPFEDFIYGQYHFNPPAPPTVVAAPGAAKEPEAPAAPAPAEDPAVAAPPSWVPSYPAALAKATGTREETKDGARGNWQAQVKDPADKIKSYYESTLQADGYTIDTATTTADGSDTFVIRATSSNGKRKMTITIASVGGAANVNIDYKGKK